MSTIIERSPIVGEERLLLTGISWEFYRRFCDELEGRRVRLTYDRGSMEIMITKRPHEFYKTLLAKLIEQTVLELDIPIASGGSMTFQREGSPTRHRTGRVLVDRTRKAGSGRPRVRLAALSTARPGG